MPDLLIGFVTGATVFMGLTVVVLIHQDKILDAFFFCVATAVFAGLVTYGALSQ